MREYKRVTWTPPGGVEHQVKVDIDTRDVEIRRLKTEIGRLHEESIDVWYSWRLASLGAFVVGGVLGLGVGILTGGGL